MFCNFVHELPKQYHPEKLPILSCPEVLSIGDNRPLFPAKEFKEFDSRKHFARHARLRCVCASMTPSAGPFESVGDAQSIRTILK